MGTSGTGAVFLNSMASRIYKKHLLFAPDVQNWWFRTCNKEQLKGNYQKPTSYAWLIDVANNSWLQLPKEIGRLIFPKTIFH
jgi:hypothetical protein